MKIAFVADANSPIARNWIAYFIERGDEVHVISLFPLLGPALPGARLYPLPLVFSQAFALSQSAQKITPWTTGPTSGLAWRTKTVLRNAIVGLGLKRFWSGYVAPLDSTRLRRPVQRLIDGIRPDIVHGLRLPEEGETLAALRGYPLVLSIWGNDLTLAASTYRIHRHLVRRALGRAHGLHADCERDIGLAYSFGYATDKPALVVPTAGGIRLGRLANAEQAARWRQRLSVPEGAPVVLNARGVRAYVRTEEYFKAIPEVLRACPDAIFVSVAVAGDATVSRLVETQGIGSSVRLLPRVSQEDLAALFRLSDVMVSPSIHDGTPNTLLEGMANGAVPLAGDLASVREWITPGENGLLFDPKDPGQISAAITEALQRPEWRAQARKTNLRIVRERADYDACMGRASDFYHQAIECWQASEPDRRVRG